MKAAVLVGLAAASFTLDSATVFADGFSDIQFWAGSGVNEAVFVIDWNDGKTAESLLWGYRWNGTATGMDMFQAIIAADPRLFAHLGIYSWGTATFGIGYDLNESGGFGVAPALSFNSAGLVIDPLASPNPDDTRVALDAADHWVEGWNTGFWNYFVKDAEPASWTGAAMGPADRLLSDGNWDGYSFAAGFVSSEPSEPVAVTPIPEPAAASLLMFTTTLLAWTQRRRS